VRDKYQSVWWGQERVGEIQFLAEAKITFSYSKEWIESKSHWKNFGAISLSLPVKDSGNLDPNKAHAFFANLLSEGEVRKWVAAAKGISVENDSEPLKLWLETARVPFL
jgi:HipA-like protein